MTGGKLTTFRMSALAACGPSPAPAGRPARRGAGGPGPRSGGDPGALGSTPAAPRRLGARPRGVEEAPAREELERRSGTPYLWAELRWAARPEGVVHLDDLLLRRVRIGLLLPEAGAELLPRVRATAAAALGWDDGRWRKAADALPRPEEAARGADR